jgi:cytochrome P450
MSQALPPGPRAPRIVQTIGWWSRYSSYMERCRRRYGDPFTLRLVGNPPFVMLADPEQIRAVFSAPPEVLHPGEGARVLEPLVGPNSVIVLDEDAHLEHRRLVLPAFHGDRMVALTDMIMGVSADQVARWPRGEAIGLHERLLELTLEVILRAVFGLEEGDLLNVLRENLTEILAFTTSPRSVLPPVPGIPSRLERLRPGTDRLILDLIEARRADNADGDDVLAMLLAARHADGEPMSAGELRDELVTLLVTGHETTASQLAWTFEQLAHAPEARRRLTDEIDGGGDAYLTATVQESLRRRPVLPNSGPRIVMEPFQLDGRCYPPGVGLVANTYLLHHDPRLYPDPYAFRPERFLHEAPGTYTWIPFGGGRRRCVGANFAMLEMKTVLRAVLSECDIAPVGPPEGGRHRAFALSPRHGARVRLASRQTGISSPTRWPRDSTQRRAFHGSRPAVPPRSGA